MIFIDAAHAERRLWCYDRPTFLSFVLNVAASHAVTLELEDLVVRFTRKDKILRSVPISHAFHQGERTAILCGNRRIRDELLGSIYGLVQPVSGFVNKQGSVSWPLGLKGGLDGKLTLLQNMRFLGTLDEDKVAPLNLDKFLNTFLDSAGLSPQARLKDLKSRDQKFFYMVVSLAFSFDVFLVPSAQFLMGSEKDKAIQFFRNVFEARIEQKTLISTSGNKKFLRDFCDKGLAIDSVGQQTFNGSVDECLEWMKSSSIQSDTVDDDDSIDESLFSVDLSNDDNQSEFLEII